MFSGLHPSQEFAHFGFVHSLLLADFGQPAEVGLDLGGRDVGPLLRRPGAPPVLDGEKVLWRQGRQVAQGSPGFVADLNPAVRLLDNPRLFGSQNDMVHGSFLFCRPPLFLG
jgi:hypothetical protein